MSDTVQSRTRRWRRGIGGGGPAGTFRRAAVAGLFALLAIAILAFEDVTIASLLVPAAAYAAGATVAALAIQRSYPHGSLGLCNAITLFRLVLVSTLLVPVFAGPQIPVLVFIIAAIALALDGVDGWLARREGLVSDFGARFDMEVDSALALVLALKLFAFTDAGPLVLVLGLPRYAFAVAGWLFPWLERPLPPSQARKAVCVLQLAALILMLLPPVSQAMGPALVIVAALALVWSFGRDVLWLWRSRA